MFSEWFTYISHIKPIKTELPHASGSSVLHKLIHFLLSVFIDMLIRFIDLLISLYCYAYPFY